jgi:hypothetical protein
MSDELEPAKLAILRALLDRFIPPFDGLPGAGSMGLADVVVGMAKGHRRYEDAIAQVVEALAQADGFANLDGERQDSAIRRVEHAARRPFELLIELAYIAYYSRPEVHARIGWRTGPLQPMGFELPAFDEAVLSKARERAPFWRRT